MSESNVQIRIESVADLRAAEATERALQTTIEQTRRLGGETDQLERQLSEVQQALSSETAELARNQQAATEAAMRVHRLADEKKRADDVTSEFSKRIPILGRVLDALRTPLGLVLALFTGLIATVKESIQAFAAQEKKFIQLDAAMAQNGLMTEANRKRYADLASEMQALTGVADDKWLEVLTTLTKFGSRPESIGMDVEAVKNLAGVLGRGPESLAEAAVLVGKVLQGNTGALSEYGIMADQTLPKAEQIADVFAKIAAVGGGQLEANLDTLSGQFGQLKNHAGDFAEALGGIFAETLKVKEGTGLISEAFRFWAAAMDSGVEASDRMENKADSVAQKLRDQKRAAEDAARAVDELGRAYDRARRDADRLTAAQDAQRSQEDREADLQEQIAIENIRGQNLDPEEEIRAEAAVRQQFREARRNRALQFEDVQQQRANQRIAQRGAEGEAAEQSVTNAEAALDQVKDLRAARATRDRLQEQFDEMTEQLGNGTAVLGDFDWDEYRRLGGRLSNATKELGDIHEQTAPELRNATVAEIEAKLEEARKTKEAGDKRRVEENQKDREFIAESERKQADIRAAAPLEDDLASRQAQNAISREWDRRDEERQAAFEEWQDARDPDGAEARREAREAQEIRNTLRQPTGPLAVARSRAEASQAAQDAVDSATGGAGINSGFVPASPSVPQQVAPGVPRPSNLPDAPPIPGTFREATPPGGASPVIDVAPATTAIQQGSARSNAAIDGLGNAIETAYLGQANRIQALTGRVERLEQSQEGGRA